MMTSSTSDLCASGAIGGLAACLEAGLPSDVLLPIKPRAKYPAYIDTDAVGGTFWKHLSKWQNGGISLDRLTALAEKQAGGGLLLGAPVADEQFVAIDLDLDDGPQAISWRDSFVQAFARAWGPLQVRRTHDFRALILASIPATEQPGSKTVIEMTLDDASIGQIEVLTSGQQCVIAGTHVSGRQIAWEHTDKSEVAAAPDLRSAKKFGDFKAIVAGITNVLDAGRKNGLVFRIEGSGHTKSGIVALADLAAPSVSKLISLLNDLPNGSDISRTRYHNILRAAGNARAGLIAQSGNFSAGDEDRLADAAAGWAARWQPPAGHAAGSIDGERAKWCDDWSKAAADGQAVLGWLYLLREMSSSDATAEVKAKYADDMIAAKYAEAQRVFEAEDLPAGTSIDLPVIARDQFTREDLVKPPSEKPQFKLLSLADLRNLPDPSWLIDKLLPDAGLIVIYGQPKHGKTFLALSMAMHVAIGRPWFGKQVCQGSVIYVIGEGAAGIKLRTAAIQKEYCIPDDAPFWTIARRVNFADDHEVDGLIDAVQAVMNQVNAATPDKPVRLVVFDTLARMIGGLDENSAQSMGLAVKASDRVKETLNCSVALVHHEGKDPTRGMRGSNALEGALDTAIRVQRDDETGVVTMKTEAQKDDEPAAAMTFTMKEVQVTATRSSLVPVLAQGIAGVPLPALVAKLNGQTRIGADALARAISDHGQVLPVGLDPTAVGIGAMETVWREEFCRRLESDPSETPQKRADRQKKAFKRARDALINQGVIGCRDAWVWFASAKNQQAEEAFTAETMAPSKGDLESLF